MHKAALAEFVLMLVMPPNAAAATVGDLLESSGRPVAFWTAVWRTVIGAALRQMSIGSTTKALILIAVTTISFRWIFFAILNWGGRAFPELAWTGPIWGVTFLLTSPLFIGFFVARRMPGREMAVWITYCLALVPATITIRSALPFFPHNIFVFVSPAGAIGVLLGSLLARRKQLRFISN